MGTVLLALRMRDFSGLHAWIYMYVG